jgi:DNA-binding NarL/FixJ family response regulator
LITGGAVAKIVKMNQEIAIQIGLAEDNEINRNIFRQKISQLPEYRLQFIAKNGHECLEELKGLPPQRLPRIVFMDIEMPVMTGTEAISIAKALYPEIHFIVLTVFDDDEKIFEAIRAGASGYLLKHEPATTLQESIRTVLEFGGAPMSPSIARKALRLLSKAPVPESSATNALPEAITDREEQILQYMVNGWDAKRIAAVLDISVLTVRKHIANIYIKLQVQSRAQVIQIAHKNKWF